MLLVSSWPEQAGGTCQGSSPTSLMLPAEGSCSDVFLFGSNAFSCSQIAGVWNCPVQDGDAGGHLLGTLAVTVCGAIGFYSVPHAF